MTGKIKQKTPGLTLLEIMVAMTLLSILTTALLLLFSRATHTYNVSYGEEGSMKRIKPHITQILNEIRGATELKAPLIYTPVSYAAYDYIDNITGLKNEVWLKWNSSNQEVTRTQYDLDINGNAISPPTASSVILADVDFIGFYLYSPQNLIIEYRISDGLPSPLTYKYKLTYSPQLPPNPDEE